MRTSYTGYVTPTEWRWVIVLSSALILLIFLPFLWVILSGGSTAQAPQFMGALHGTEQAANDLSLIVQGTRGDFLAHFLHTPEPHPGVFTGLVYTALGGLARLIDLDPVVIFHVARVGAALFMYMAIYYLGAAIWSKLRTRRVFFALAAFGAGLGWLAAPLTGSAAAFPDVQLSTLYPFQTTLVNVHYPLALGMLAILASAIIEALKPGSQEEPDVNNGGLLVFLLSLLLSLVYPEVLIPVAVAFIALLIARSVRHDRMPLRDIRWMLWFSVPGLPILIYFIVTLLYNPVYSAVWHQANANPPPDPVSLLLSLGLPLLIALPGIMRALRRFEPDGDQFMLGWLLAMLVLIYLTPVVQLYFATGLMLPIAYFGARAAEDFWFPRVVRRWRMRILVALLPVIAISHLLVLLMPVLSINGQPPEATRQLSLDRDYRQAFAWLYAQAPPNTVVLAAPRVGKWLPAWAGMPVVYGMPNWTMDAPLKARAVQQWYSADPDEGYDCSALLNGMSSQTTAFSVRYVLYGPQERALGSAACRETLVEAVRFDRLVIYRVRMGRLDPMQ